MTPTAQQAHDSAVNIRKAIESKDPKRLVKWSLSGIAWLGALNNQTDPQQAAQQAIALSGNASIDNLEHAIAHKVAMWYAFESDEESAPAVADLIAYAHMVKDALAEYIKAELEASPLTIHDNYALASRYIREYAGRIDKPIHTVDQGTISDAVAALALADGLPYADAVSVSQIVRHVASIMEPTPR